MGANSKSSIFRIATAYIFSEKTLVATYAVTAEELLTQLDRAISSPVTVFRHRVNRPRGSILGSHTKNRIVLFSNNPHFYYFPYLGGVYSFEGQIREIEGGCMIDGVFRPPESYKIVFTALAVVFLGAIFFGFQFTIRFYSAGKEAAYEMSTVLTAIAAMGFGLLLFLLLILKIGAILDRPNYNAITRMLSELGGEITLGSFS